MIEIEAPDGSIVEFPAGTPDETIRSVMAKSYPPTQAQPQQAPQQALQQPVNAPPQAPQGGFLQTLKDATQGVVQGATMNFGDEIMAAPMAPLGAIARAITGGDEGKGFTQRIADNYNSALAFNRQTQNQAAANSPTANIVGQVVGGALTAGGLAKSGITLLNAARPTVPNMVARGAGEGAIYGAIGGLGRGEGVEDRVASAGQDAAFGGILGAGVGAIAARGANRAAQRAIPAVDDLKAKAKADYQAADNAGVVLNPQGYGKTVDDIFSTAANQGLDKTLHPRATAAIARLEELKAQPITLQTAETMRRILNSAAQSTDAFERKIVYGAINKLDDYVANLKPQDVLLQNPNIPLSDATKALSDARSTWARVKKSEAITTALTKAERRAASTGSGGNTDNAIRQNIRAILDNPSRVKGFSAEERDAMERIVKGTATQNMLRLVGKLSPQGNGLMGMLGIGGTVANPTFAAVPAAGFVAKQFADRTTSKNAAVLEALVRSGGQVPAAKPISKNKQMLIDALLANQPNLSERVRAQLLSR